MAVLAISLMLLAGTAALADPSLSGRVMRVAGPDTIVVKGPGDVLYTVHLRGTSAADGAHPSAFETEARLISQLVGHHVTLTNISGSGNRLEAVVHLGDSDVNREMISEGMLEFDEETAEPELVYDYTTAEEKARLQSLGVWRPMKERKTMAAPVDPAEPPEGGWQFRPVPLAH